MIIAYIFKPNPIISPIILTPKQKLYNMLDLTLLEEGDLKNLCKENLKTIPENDLV